MEQVGFSIQFAVGYPGEELLHSSRVDACIDGKSGLFLFAYPVPLFIEVYSIPGSGYAHCSGLNSRELFFWTTLPWILDSWPKARIGPIKRESLYENHGSVPYKFSGYVPILHAICSAAITSRKPSTIICAEWRYFAVEMRKWWSAINCWQAGIMARTLILINKKDGKMNDKTLIAMFFAALTFMACGDKTEISEPKTVKIDVPEKAAKGNSANDPIAWVSKKNQEDCPGACIRLGEYEAVLFSRQAAPNGSPYYLCAVYDKYGGWQPGYNVTDAFCHAGLVKTVNAYCYCQRSGWAWPKIDSN